jgi:hypothetical protein
MVSAMDQGGYVQTYDLQKVRWIITTAKRRKVKLPWAPTGPELKDPHAVSRFLATYKDAPEDDDRTYLLAVKAAADHDLPLPNDAQLSRAACFRFLREHPPLRARPTDKQLGLLGRFEDWIGFKAPPGAREFVDEWEAFIRSNISEADLIKSRDWLSALHKDGYRDLSGDPDSLGSIVRALREIKQTAEEEDQLLRQRAREILIRDRDPYTLIETFPLQSAVIWAIWETVEFSDEGDELLRSPRIGRREGEEGDDYIAWDHVADRA